jgi:hypothetical protein
MTLFMYEFDFFVSPFEFGSKKIRNGKHILYTFIYIL